MTEEEKSESEAEALQMRRLNALRIVVQTVALRWAWPTLAVTLAVAAALTVALMRRTGRSYERAVVTTGLQFYPKSASRIPAMSEQQVYQILTRGAMVKMYIEEAHLTGIERLRAWQDLSVMPSSWDRRLFEITAKANKEERAVEKANCFADICLREYAAYRRADLERWIKTIDARREELLTQIARVDADEQKLARTYGVLSPESDLERLRLTVLDQKERLSEASVKLSNGDLRVRRLKEDLGSVSAKAFGRADELKALQDELSQADKEVSRLRALYTERNPRLVIVMKTRDECQARVNAFLRENEMPSMTGAELERLTAVYDRLRDATAEWEMLRLSRDALAKEVAENERQMQTLADLQPRFSGFRRRRETLQETIQNLEETISDIRYLQASIAGDLTQVERATSGKVASPYQAKNFAFGLVGGVFAGCGLLSMLVLLDFLFGCVRGPRELGGYLGLRLAGAVAPEAKCPKGVKWRDAVDRLCFDVEKMLSPKGVYYVGALPGGALLPELGDAFHMALSMDGCRSAVVDIVPAKTFSPPDGAECLASVYMKGERGWFARASAKSLSMSETRLLAEDLASLRERFDVVFLQCSDPAVSGVFVGQMLEIASLSFFYVGARLTPRAFMRRLARSAERAGREAMILMGGRLSARDFETEACE